MLKKLFCSVYSPNLQKMEESAQNAEDSALEWKNPLQEWEFLELQVLWKVSKSLAPEVLWFWKSLKDQNQRFLEFEDWRKMDTLEVINKFKQLHNSHVVAYIYIH